MPASPDTTGWVREPRQARSQATMERFVEAVRELLDEGRAFEDITVADIVERADRTVGSFYARFEDKHAVLSVLVEQLDDRIRQVVRAFCDPVRWEGEPAAAFVAESVRLNVSAYRKAGPLYRAALLAATTDQRFRDRRLAGLRFSAEAQKGFLLGRAAECRCADVARASDRMCELVSTTLDHELLFGSFTTTAPASDPELVAELTTRSLAFLGLDPVDVDADRRPLA